MLRKRLDFGKLKYKKLVKVHEKNQIEHRKKSGADRRKNREENEAGHAECHLDSEKQSKVDLKNLKMMMISYC